VRVSLSNPEQILLPGMTAYVSIAVASRENVLLVPNAALRFRPSDDRPGAGDSTAPKAAGDATSGVQPGRKRDGASGTVFRVDHGELKAVNLQLGITDNRNTEVTGGDLKVGDLVVTGENVAGGGKPSSVGMRLF